MALLSGVKVSLSGREFTLPPLTLGALKKIGDKISILSEMSTVPTPEQIDAMCQIILSSVNRNYPEVTQDELLELIDLGNLKSVFEAVLGASGIVRSNDVGEIVNP